MNLHLIHHIYKPIIDFSTTKDQQFVDKYRGNHEDVVGGKQMALLVVQAV